MAFKKDGYVKPKSVTDLSIGHVTFRVNETPRDGTTFSLVAGDAAQAKERNRPLFTGFVDAKVMANEARTLAAFFDRLAAKQELGGL